MALILALEKLYDDVLARFTSEAPALADASYFGWREPPRQLVATTRIVWVPGDPAGNAGEVQPPKFPGREPNRPLGTLRELFTVYLTAADPLSALSERAQWKACRSLYDQWYRAVYLAAYGTFAIRSQRWVLDRGAEGRHGGTLVVVADVQSMLPDATITTAPVDTEAHITPALTPSLPGTADPTIVVEP